MTETRSPRPRWVKAFLIIVVAVVALVLVVALLTGGGEGHGPGRHMGARTLTA